MALHKQMPDPMSKKNRSRFRSLALSAPSAHRSERTAVAGAVAVRVAIDVTNVLRVTEAVAVVNDPSVRNVLNLSRLITHSLH